MSANLRKKARERAYLEEFMALCRDVPADRVLDSEEPDFLITTPDGVLGVEVVVYLRGQSVSGKMLGGGSSEHADELARGHVVEDARRLFERVDPRRLYPRRLNVSCWWDRHVRLDRTKIRQLSAALSDLVVRNLPTVDAPEVVLGWCELRHTPLTGFVSHVWVQEALPGDEALWANGEGGPITLVPEQVQALLNHKQKKLPKYLARCDRAWLLIFAGTTTFASMVNADERVRAHLFSSGFERVYLYDRFRGGVLRLSVSSETESPATGEPWP